MEITKFDRNLIIIVTTKFNDPIIDEIPEIYEEKKLQNLQNGINGIC